MAKKSGFKDLLMKKGEKIALFVALGVFALFVLIGVSSATSAKDPNALSKQLTQLTTSKTGDIENTQKTAEKLPEAYEPGRGRNDNIRVPENTFVASGNKFEPVQLPSTRRDNPRVLSPIESQVNFYAGSYKGYDRRFYMQDGELKAEVGVLNIPSKNEFNYSNIPDKLKPATTPKKGLRPGNMQPMQPMPPLPPMGEVPPRPPIPGMEVPGLPGQAGVRDERIVQYMSWEDAEKAKLPPARTIYPIRMAIIQASFPLKDQLEEIKRALRLRNLAEAKMESSAATIDARIKANAPVVPGAPVAAPVPVPPPPPAAGGTGTSGIPADDSPEFTDMIVERRITGPDGQTTVWESFDQKEKWREKFFRYDTPTIVEEGYLPYFLRPQQLLSYPLPIMAEGFQLNYPPAVTLPSIYFNSKRLEDNKAQKQTKEDSLKKYKKGSDFNLMSPPGSTAPGSGFGDDMIRTPAMVLPPGFKPNPMGGDVMPPGVAGQDPNKLDVEYILLRFIDPELKPAHSYEYRIKIQMRNPNFGNKTKVANESMANEEFLESAWYVVPQKVTVPNENYLYVYSAKKYEENVKKMVKDAGGPIVLGNVLELKEVQDGRKVVVQMQRWQENIIAGNKQEPIGNWIQAEMPVGPGDFVGRRTLVELPLWRSGVKNPKAGKDSTDIYSGSYVLPSIDVKVPMIEKWPTDTKFTLPRARILDFRTSNVLIDFDGGKVATKAGTQSTADDTAADLLILRDDGKIEVRREIKDMANTVPPTDRAVRDNAWRDWVNRVRDIQTVDGGTNTGPGGTTPNFGNGRGADGR